MGVQYKKNGIWYDISSSSNNAVDAIENGNLNPVTSNAVYDALEPVDISSTVTVGSGITLRANTLHVVKSGKVVNVSFIIDSISDMTSQYITVLTGLPTPKLSQELTGVSFVNSTMYYAGFFFDGSLRMYERTSGFARMQFTYIAA